MKGSVSVLQVALLCYVFREQAWLKVVRGPERPKRPLVAGHWYKAMQRICRNNPERANQSLMSPALLTSKRSARLQNRLAYNLVIAGDLKTAYIAAHLLLFRPSRLCVVHTLCTTRVLDLASSSDTSCCK